MIPREWVTVLSYIIALVALILILLFLYTVVRIKFGTSHDRRNTQKNIPHQVREGGDSGTTHTEDDDDIITRIM